jgi:hypothetical protein
MVVKISPLKIWTDNFTYNKLFITRRLQRSYALLSHNICPTFNLHNVMNNVLIPMYIGSILTEGKTPLVKEVEKIVRWQCRDHLIS